MLEKKSSLISFLPGDKCSSPTTPGKIVIHDRKLVEEEVLPIYFNHKSFASLRRQLSYFSFVRAGKSSRGKVTYSNDSVFEIADILKLKRRSSSTEKKHQSQQHQRSSQKEHYQGNALMAPSADVVSAVNSGMLNAAKANNKLESMKDCPQPAITSAYCRTSSTTHSSLSASSDNEGATIKKAANSNNNIKKKRSSSVQKYKLRRKDRARLKKMLYYNKIVPFIHFSMPANLVEVDTNSRGGGTKRESGTGLDETKKKRSNTNETAINALLSLGAP
jgi:hypothetical protein